MTLEQRDLPPYLTTSPEGKPVLGMRVGGKDWILLTSKRTPLAERLREEFQEYFQLESTLGPAFDWRSSLEEHRLVEIEMEGRPVENVSGIYVNSEQFDKFLDTKFIDGL